MKNDKRFVAVSMPQLPDFDPIEQVDQIATDIFTFVNYEQLKKEYEAKGLGIKEDKGFYGWRVIHRLESCFKGKTAEEIEKMLSRMMRD